MNPKPLPHVALIALALAACSGGDTTASVSGTAPSAEAATDAADTAAEPAQADDAMAQAAAPAPEPATGTAARWQYDSQDADGGTRRTATISSRDGAAQLIFRDAPVGGKAVFLDLDQGDFQCDVGCDVRIVADGGAEDAVRASRPDTPQPRLSLRQPERLWRSVLAASTVSIVYPTASGESGTVEFDVAGADAGMLPGWD